MLNKTDYWYCFANEEGTGMVECSHTIKEDPEEGYEGFDIMMYQLFQNHINNYNN